MAFVEVLRQRVLFVVLLISAPKALGACLTAADYKATLAEAIHQAGLVSSANAEMAASVATSFPYVRESFAQQPARAYCVSALALSKNNYQYYKSLVMVDRIWADGSVTSVPFLIQMASIQAFENSGPKPWVGVRLEDFQISVGKLQASSFFVPEAENGVTIADFKSRVTQASSQKGQVDKVHYDVGYLGDVTLATNGDTSLVLVSQIQNIVTGNIFTSAYTARGWLLKVSGAGIVREVAEIKSLFAFLTEIERSNDASAPKKAKDQASQLTVLP